jgi:hypothetical protein
VRLQAANLSKAFTAWAINKMKTGNIHEVHTDIAWYFLDCQV